MKAKKTILFLSLAAVSAVVLSFNLIFPQKALADAPSPELIAKGKELFYENKALGGKYACILCHKKEKAIKRSIIEKLDDPDLASVINRQLLKEAKGTKELAADSEEMKALVAYIRKEHAK